MNRGVISQRLWLAVVCLCLGAAVWLGGRTVHSDDVDTSASSEEGQYELRFVYFNDNQNSEAFIFHTTTGQAWRRNALKWNKVPEIAPIPPGKFDLILRSSTGNSFWTFRLDQRTGKTWFVNAEGKWEPYADLEK